MRKSRHSRRSISLLLGLVMSVAMLTAGATPAAADGAGTWCVLVMGQTVVCVDT